MGHLCIHLHPQGLQSGQHPETRLLRLDVFDRSVEWHVVPPLGLTAGYRPHHRRAVRQPCGSVGTYAFQHFFLARLNSGAPGCNFQFIQYFGHFFQSRLSRVLAFVLKCLGNIAILDTKVKINMTRTKPSARLNICNSYSTI